MQREYSRLHLSDTVHTELLFRFPPLPPQSTQPPHRASLRHPHPGVVYCLKSRAALKYASSERPQAPDQLTSWLPGNLRFSMTKSTPFPGVTFSVNTIGSPGPDPRSVLPWSSPPVGWPGPFGSLHYLVANICFLHTVSGFFHFI